MSAVEQYRTAARDSNYLARLSLTMSRLAAESCDYSFLDFRRRDVELASSFKAYAQEFTSCALERFEALSASDLNSSQVALYQTVVSAAESFVDLVALVVDQSGTGVKRKVSVVVAAAKGNNRVLIDGEQALVVIDYYQLLKASLFTFFRLQSNVFASVIASEVMTHACVWKDSFLPFQPRMWEVASDIDTPFLSMIMNDILFFILIHEVAHARGAHSEDAENDEIFADQFAFGARHWSANSAFGPEFAQQRLKSRLACLAMAFFCWDRQFYTRVVCTSNEIRSPSYDDVPHPPWQERLHRIIQEAEALSSETIVTDLFRTAVTDLWGNEMHSLSSAVVLDMEFGKQHADDLLKPEISEVVRELCKWHTGAHTRSALRWQVLLGGTAAHWYIDHFNDLRITTDVKVDMLNEKFEGYLRDPSINVVIRESEEFTLSALCKRLRAVGTAMRDYMKRENVR